MRETNKCLVGKRDGKRKLGKPACKQQDNIKMDTEVIERGLY
jgi:hypothetical protein